MSKLKTEVSLVEKNGRTLSKRTEFYENGQVAKVGVYSIGLGKWSWDVPIGVVKSYYENGQLKAEINYSESGSLEGESSYFNQEGKLIKRLTYSKDRLVKEEVFEEAIVEKKKAF